jgi:hypothetical protein
MAEADRGTEVDQNEIERVFRRLDNKTVACIDQAAAGWHLRGSKIVVGFRLERSGEVKKVQVEAPSLLQRHGIYDCIAPMVRGLRFPRGSRALVLHYPYRIN